MAEKYTIQQAQDVLLQYSDRNLPDRDYWVAIVEGRLPQYYLHEFRLRRDKYSDELPDEDVRLLIDREIREGVNPGRMIQYKCQANYVAGLGLAFEAAITDEIITDPAIIEQTENFRKSDLLFTVGDPKNPDRINSINGILNLTITYLEQQVDSE